VSSTTTTTRRSLRAWMREFLPARLPIDTRERLRVVAGAFVGLLATGLLCRLLLPASSALPWLFAPLGASAVLVFAVPSSPLAQPWAAVGGNTLSALVGIACVHTLGNGPGAAAVAVALAIAVMLAARCLHPPGGASALLMVLAQVADPAFAFFPVLVSSALLVAAGIGFATATGRRYPHGQQPAAPSAQPTATRPQVSAADVDAVLRRHNEIVDIGRADLQDLLEEAELQAHRRRLGAVRCADIMSRDLATAEYGTLLQDAWATLRARRIKALPVVDRARRIVGIVTLNDFMKGAELDLHEGWAQRLRSLIRATPATHSDKPEVVGQIMTRQVRVASVDRPIGELVPLFADTGHHHIPIIDAEQRLVGIITQSDLVAALSRA
jgi:CBS domain-containing membrane protein